MTAEEVCARAARLDLTDPPGAAKGAGFVIALKAAAGEDTAGYQAAYALLSGRCKPSEFTARTRVAFVADTGQGEVEVVHGASGGPLRRWAATASKAQRRRLLLDVAGDLEVQ